MHNNIDSFEMFCGGVNRFDPSGAYFQYKDDIDYGVSYVALAIILVAGFALSICSLIAYLPPNFGHCGGALCISSLITFVVLIVGKKCSRSEECQPAKSEVEQKTVVPNISPENQTGSVLVRAQESISSFHSTSYLPDEVYIFIFEYLGVFCISRLSRVCKEWNRIASVNALWQKFCIQKMFCIFGEDFSIPLYYKEAYRNSSCKSKSFRSNAPYTSPSVMQIPKPTGLSKYRGANKFLIAKDRCFICQSGLPDQRFEVWDVSLTKCLFRKAFPYLNDVCIRLIGKMVYFIGWEQMPDNFCRNIYVCPFNTETESFMPTLEFSQKHRNHFKTKTQFAIDGNKAFTSQEDGGIRVWELKLEGKPNTKSSIHVLDPQRRYSGKFTSYQEMTSIDQLYERKVLRGHTKEITALQIFGNFLFSSAHDGAIKQWDLSTYASVQTIETGLGEGVTFFEVAGRYVFGVTEKRNSIYQWDLVTKDLLFTADLQYPCDAFLPVYNLLLCSYVKDSTTRCIEIYDLVGKGCFYTYSFGLIPSYRVASENLMQIVDGRLYIADSFQPEGAYPFECEYQLAVWDFFLRDIDFTPSYIEVAGCILLSFAHRLRKYFT